ncbi:atlastin isoform X1 [Eurytemora carolleeae]|uniref:atlastin isoform X1 n=1 Tax=Eurytemora carolleeae TaxID=1294199 RepID=UPI000C76798E|nr:atlastin isoform X1 [Eurytemora carolleeae]XP_023340880.1 atlastin isoform X1 [Eurytemora carolleeae]XP_023340881.1 atlastin isoform X1 [Eurytemora carolleeae]|eukprot:XP_023340879.1 atlastin-like isoform X1 [Eurytemora affinis]
MPRGGSERDTTGILMWSEVFLVKTPFGKEVAVALMDTQGSFDKSSTVRDTATIFALSLMTSSVLVYNLFNNIQEDDLQHLHYFTEYGRLALEDSGEVPFQRLQFLVRDWQYAYEEAYGEKGGQNILDKQLKIDEKQHTELQALRSNLTSCFSEMSCFLLPHPGKHVATNPNFKGELKDIDEEFLAYLQEFMPLLLSPRNLVIKSQGGKEVKTKEIIQFFKSYIDVFRGNSMPEPKSMLEVTIEVNNLVSLASAKELYTASMESLCGGDRPYLNEQVLEIEHKRILDSAILEFDARKKMGGEEFSHKYREQLLRELEDSFIQYKAHNDSKNIFKAANTPITLFSIWSILYIISQFCALIMLTPVSNLCNLLMWGLVFTGATWAYVKYSGEFGHVGSQIEDCTGWIWDNLFQVLLSKAAEQGTTFAVRQAAQRMSSVSSPSNERKKTR